MASQQRMPILKRIRLQLTRYERMGAASGCLRTPARTFQLVRVAFRLAPLASLTKPSTFSQRRSAEGAAAYQVAPPHGHGREKSEGYTV
jgi:hypothetical protein